MAGAAKVMRFGGKKDKVFLFFFFFGSKGEMWNSSEQKKRTKEKNWSFFRIEELSEIQIGTLRV